MEKGKIMIDESLTSLAKNGILGILLVIAMICIFFLYKEAKKERDERLKDMKEVWQADVNFRSELKVLLDSILQILKSKK